MDAPKAKRDKEKRKRGLSRHLPAEFLAEYPIDECIERLQRRKIDYHAVLEGGANRLWLRGVQVRLEPWDQTSTRVIIERYTPVSIFGSHSEHDWRVSPRRVLQGFPALTGVLFLLISLLVIWFAVTRSPEFDAEFVGILVAIALVSGVLGAISLVIWLTFAPLPRLGHQIHIIEEALGSAFRDSFVREKKHK